MKYSCLPRFPLIVFGVIEPALLVWAYIIGLRSPFTFFAAQAPNTPLSPSNFPPQAEALTLQMLNVLLLLAPMALICCWTLNPTTTKTYLFAVALADYGHMYATYRGVGSEYFWNVGEWNDMVWGNVGVSGGLNLLRLATLMGWFGRVEGISQRWKRE